MKTIETEKYIFSEPQDDRIWLHSKELGYGFWVYNSEIEKLILIKTNISDNPDRCPICGNL